jgi:ATP:ADP antiporter, AAA family
VLASYYILRPIRDQMGVAGGVNNLPWLFTGTLVVMLALNVPFSALVKSLPRRQFIPLTYRFFAVTILAFGAVLHWATPEQTIWIGRFFFIWTSVFNLFVVSIFWALVADIFSSEQGKRLFGFIAAGATLGAIVGSVFTALLAQSVSTPFLLVGAAVLLEVAILCVRRLSRLSAKMSEHPHPERDEAPISGKVLAGFVKTMRSPYLLNTGIRVPTLVIHGSDDPLVPVEAGNDMAANIPGAKLKIIAGMGHDLATGLIPILVDAIAEHCEQVDMPDR